MEEEGAEASWALTWVVTISQTGPEGITDIAFLSLDILHLRRDLASHIIIMSFDYT